MHHVFFLFDYEPLAIEARDLVDAAESGDFDVALREARAIRDHLGGREWILEGLGTNIAGLDLEPAGAWLTGLAFLIVLSQYLKPIPYDYGYLDLDVLGRVAADFDWDNRDVRLLTEGMTLSTAVLPEEPDDPLARPPVSDSRWKDPYFYWWWIRPPNVFRSGWWDRGQISRLREGLDRLCQELDNNEAGRLGLAETVSKSDIVKYCRTLERLLSTAWQGGMGLMFVSS